MVAIWSVIACRCTELNGRHKPLVDVANSFGLILNVSGASSEHHRAHSCRKLEYVPDNSNLNAGLQHLAHGTWSG
jgi:hypothetical protein